MSDKPTDANIFAKACIRVNSVFNFNTLNNIRILFIGDFDIEVIISDANIVYKVNIGQNFDLVSGNFGVVGIVVVVKKVSLASEPLKMVLPLPARKLLIPSKKAGAPSIELSFQRSPLRSMIASPE